VAVFFYPWYGTPKLDGGWVHWQQNRRRPPAEIASAFYPARGVYSSSDEAVLRAQLDDIVSAGGTTVVVSWWGRGSREDALLDRVLRAVRARGLRAAVHVEPYPGRSPDSVVADVEFLRSKGVFDFYVYDSTAYSDDAWAAALRRLGGVRLFANTALPGKAAAGGFEGLYTYDVFVYDGSAFSRICNSAARLGLACAPSVGPGYDARAATGDDRMQARGDGGRYDAMWRQAIRARPSIVTVTSYNEWHEGTQIEPARQTPGYLSYDGSYGLTGTAAERAYLERTAYWAKRYDDALRGGIVLTVASRAR
jgi:hypothetical protein